MDGKVGRKLLQILEGDFAEYGVIVLFVLMIAGLFTLWCCTANSERPITYRRLHFTDGSEQPFLSIDDYYSGEEEDPVQIVKENHKNQGQLLLARMQSFPYKPSENIKAHTECLIDLEEFEEGDEVTALPCLHQFHTHCIKEWAEEKGNETICPVCKLNLMQMLDNQDEQQQSIV